MDPKTQGETVAREILAAFDAAVDEAKALLGPKPAPDAVAPQFEPLLARYREKMTALNQQYLALRADPPSFGAANIWLGANRGKSVFRKDNLLGTFVAHYRFFVPGPAVVEFVETSLVRLIETAVAR